ncbi:MAG TPA: DUF4010 domain-containing protein, partial [Vicinamibacterales bacterium]|nr:DUF4010 domain-containing protein [Vicinamibacterales bacterium]
MSVYLANRFWGERGIFTTASLLGLTDVDALTMSMARGVSATTTLDIAARAIAIGVAANTLLKLLMAVVLSAGAFRAIAGGTLAMMLAAAVGWLMR